MPRVDPAAESKIQRDGWFLRFAEWKLIFEPQKKKKATEKNKSATEVKKLTPEQIAKERKKKIRRINWVVDRLGESAFDSIVAALPEISAEFLGGVSEQALELSKALTGDDALWLERIARFCNVMAAMDATMRFEETATRKHRPSCLNPCKPCCVKYPKASLFEHLRRDEVAPKLRDTLSELLADELAAGAQSASRVLEQIAQLSARLATLLAQASRSSNDARDSLFALFAPRDPLSFPLRR